MFFSMFFLAAPVPGGSGGGEVSKHAPHRSEGFDGGPRLLVVTCYDSASCDGPKGYEGT